MRAALGIESAQPPELLPLTSTVLELLRRLRRSRPLLLVVDDLQWVLSPRTVGAHLPRAFPTLGVMRSFD